MSIEQQLTTRLVEAMRAKRSEEVALLRMLKSRAGEVQKAPGFDRAVDDEFWLDIVNSFVKQQSKALVEFEKAGDKGAEHVAHIKFEIEYLAPFLPQMKGEDEVRAIVREAIAKTGASDPKMAGKVVGFVMKDHKGEVDAAMVKRVATEELS